MKNSTAPYQPSLLFSKMARSVEQYIAYHKLLPADSQTVLVAVSGGVDSVLMACLLHSLGVPLAVAHCHFGLRGAESEADAHLVEELAAGLTVAFHQQRFDTKEHAQQTKQSTQMAARRLRYDWFAQLTEECNYSAVAIAHHANDALETTLFNMTKGTGLAGIRGIKPLRNNIIRPLLGQDKRDIIEAAKSSHISWREDASNHQTGYIRNRVRHKVLPVLQSINPSLVHTFADTHERLLQADKLLEELLEETAEGVCKKETDIIKINIKSLTDFSSPLLLLHHILASYDFGYRQSKEVFFLIEGLSGSSVSNSRATVWRDRDYFVITTNNNGLQTENGQVWQLPEQSDTFYLTSRYGIRVKKFPYCKDLKIDKRPNTATLDADLLDKPLTIRRWQHGDRFEPFGMDGKSKLVSDYLINAKVPQHQKQNTFVVCNNKDIVWLAGHRIDGRFAVSAKTKTVCLLEWEE